MKTVYRHAMILVLALLTGFSFSQGTTLIIFSAKGEKFTLEFNGSTQNNQPESKVVVENIFGPSFKFKVFVEGATQPPLSKTTFNKINGSFYYVIRKDSKGKYSLESTSYDWSDKVEQELRATSTATTTGAATTTEKSAQTKETTTTEKTSQTKETNATATAATTTSTSTAKHWCDSPVSDADFIAGYSSISYTSFDPTRMSAAKGFANNHCLLSSQVKEIVDLFDMESMRLDFAKFAYTHTYDPENYSVVNDAFHSKSSAESLKKYIDTKNK
jgi:hypothetical protein